MEEEGEPARLTDFQNGVLAGVADGGLREWFGGYSGWHGTTRRDVAVALGAGLRRYVTSRQASAVLGQRESLVDMGQVIRDGMVLLVHTGRGELGATVSSMVGSAVINTLAGLLRSGSGVSAGRTGFLLVVEGLYSYEGVRWPALLEELPDYGGSVLGTMQTLSPNILLLGKVGAGGDGFPWDGGSASSW